MLRKLANSIPRFSKSNKQPRGKTAGNRKLNIEACIIFQLSPRIMAKDLPCLL